MKIVIHREYEVTGCENCPYYEMQHDTARNESWPECVLPLCVLDGRDKRIKSNTVDHFIEMFGLKKLNEMYKDCGVSWSMETRFFIKRNGKVIHESELEYKE